MNKPKPCYCEAYLGKNGKPFPHRLDSGKCKELYNHADISDDFKEGMARDFERKESQAYNKELSIFEVRFV